MTNRNKRILLVAVVMLAVVSVCGAAIATSLGGTGMIDVQVRERGGQNVSVHVPVSVVLLALQFAPRCAFGDVPDEAFRYAGAARVLTDRLGELPDFTMVEVDGADEHVRVRKAGDRLVVDIDNTDETVHVSLPLRVVEKVAKKLETGRVIL